MGVAGAMVEVAVKVLKSELEEKKWTGEMAQAVKCLQKKPEDRSLHPKHSCENRMWWCASAALGLEGQRRVGAQELIGLPV